ncbi:MAG: PQQ-binding-like beta-propeller repeat protein [Pirellulales bacterium]|nr:PQQ-binding-like beta-propeller repeat protein [Pirellulales bacterium]
MARFLRFELCAVVLRGMICLSALCAMSAVAARAGDWPTWRYNAQRTAVTPEALPDSLRLAWTRELGALTPAWKEDERLWFDAVYEPVAAGQLLFVGSSRNDSVTAFDTRSGEVRWRFFAEGPVRLAPLVHQGRVYFGSDDGNFYCLDAATGSTVWKLHVALGERHVLGNSRLISVWPVRGGAVMAGDKICFTVGVWPFEGTSLYIVDAATGGIVRTGDVGTAPETDDTTLTDLSPQGHLAASGDRVFIPCGRSKAACYDLKAGRLVDLAYDIKGRTDFYLSTNGPYLFHGGGIYNADTREAVSIRAPRPLAQGNLVYAADDGDLVAYDLTKVTAKEGKDRRGNPTKILTIEELWRMPCSDLIEGVPTEKLARQDFVTAHPLELDLIAGTKLYGHQADKVFAVELGSSPEAKPARAWQAAVPGTLSRVIAADARLFVVTLEGAIHCLAADAAAPVQLGDKPQEYAANDTWTRPVAEMLAAAGTQDGYCLVLGIKDGRLIDELVRQSNLQIIALDADAARVGRLRETWQARGLYGNRVCAIAADPLAYGLPAYLASLVISEDPARAGIDRGSEFAQGLYGVLRPYGGTAWFPLTEPQHEAFAKLVAAERLSKAQVERRGTWTTITRPGALVGAADWTHEYGDPGNTLMSPDELVRAPLGVLWFGGPSSNPDIYYDRHDWGPSMAVIDGRIFINGPEKLTAVDVYTGRLLWQVPLSSGRSLGRAGNFTVSGFHFVATHDALYLVQDKHCLKIDPASGATQATFTLPDKSDRWGRIRLADDRLIVEVFRELGPREPVPARVVAIDRHTGAAIWSRDAEFSFPVFAVGTGKVFCFDGRLEKFYADMRRKGLTPKAGKERFLLALDAASGEVLWRVPTEVVVTWMAYSQSLGTLVVSNKDGLAAYQGEDGRMLWRKDAVGQGFGGHPESVWDKVILYNDRIIDQRGPGLSYYLETGEPMTMPHPISGEPVAWEFTKQGHHCNYAVACQNLLTFRAADAGFFDMVTGGTGRLKGFRSGCRNSLLPADGVLNAPNFASGCVCNYSLFTSLSFVNVPDAEIWTYSALKAPAGPIDRVGINFGAPGDRRDPQGSLWLDFPSVGGSSPDVPVEMTPPDARVFRHHASQLSGAGLKWVAASGVEGVRSIRIPLGRGGDKRPESSYTVRLYFAEPDDHRPGDRVFDVSLQGEKVLERFDLVGESGAPRQMLMREFADVDAGSDLLLEFTPQQGQPLICGVEVVAEK